MQLLLVICFLIPLVCIGYFVSCLDKFIAEKGFLLETDKPSPVAIVLGDTELAKQVNVILEKDRIQVLKLTEPYMVEKYRKIQYLFALSENDADNMVLIKIGSKVYGIKNTVAICNDSRNEGMFIRESIPYLSSKGATAQNLYEAVFQRKEVQL